MTDKRIDEALVKRAQQGQPQAFNALVCKYQNKIANLVYRYIPNPSDTLDVVQETFIKAYRALADFRGDSSFYTWLSRIAINTAKNHRLYMKKRSAEYSLDEAGRYDSEDTLKEHSAPENHWIQQELGQAIQNAVNSLPEELKTAITLREVAGLSYHEIAEMMQCPLGTVRSRIFRARELIDAKLKDDPL